jgi:hypothetical protein
LDILRYCLQSLQPVRRPVLSRVRCAVQGARHGSPPRSPRIFSRVSPSGRRAAECRSRLLKKPFADHR